MDYFHVVERVGEISHRSLSGGEEARRAWLGILKRMLKVGDIEELERVVAASSYEEQSTDLAYLSRNRDRMLRGLQGSGSARWKRRRGVLGSPRDQLRLKGASVCWTEDHAEGILHLRAHAKSGRCLELEHTVLANTGWRQLVYAGGGMRRDHSADFGSSRPYAMCIQERAGSGASGQEA